MDSNWYIHLLSPSVEKRFFSKVRKTDSCWLWEPPRSKKKDDPFYYGDFFVGMLAGRRAHDKAHRVSYCIAYGAFPNDLRVCHYCDNPHCVRPDHLFLATNSENVHDMWNKGRNRSPGAPGVRNHFSILDDEKVREMRSLYDSGMMNRRISERFGVSEQLTWQVVKRRTWRHVV